MKVQVIKRGRKVEFKTIFMVGSQEYVISFEHSLKAGKKEGNEGLDAFMETLMAGGDVMDCFDAMDDHPEIDADAELKEVIAEGKKRMHDAIAAALKEIVEAGAQAERMLAALEVTADQVVEPSEGKGICRVCNEEFTLHGIAGMDDVCMAHVPGGYI